MTCLMANVPHVKIVAEQAVAAQVNSRGGSLLFLKIADFRQGFSKARFVDRVSCLCCLPAWRMFFSYCKASLLLVSGIVNLN